MIAMKEIYWAAGFLEGEGCFAHTSLGNLIVTASQVQREPLERLVRAFGGKIWTFHDQKIKAHVIHRWDLHSSKAVALMMTLYAELSPKRQQTITGQLQVWRSKLPYTRYRTHCPAGHPYDVANTRYQKNGKGRQCRICGSGTKRRALLKRKQQ